MRIIQCPNCGRYIHNAPGCYHCAAAVSQPERPEALRGNGGETLLRAGQLLERGRFDEALEAASSVLRWEPEHAGVFWLRLLARRRCTCALELLTAGFPWAEDPDFCNALQYASGGERQACEDLRDAVDSVRDALKKALADQTREKKRAAGLPELKETMRKETDRRRENLFSLWSELQKTEQRMMTLEADAKLLTQEHFTALDAAERVASAVAREAGEMGDCPEELRYSYRLRLDAAARQCAQAGQEMEALRQNPIVREFSDLETQRVILSMEIDGELANLRRYEAGVRRTLEELARIESDYRSALARTEAFDFSAAAAFLGEEMFSLVLRTAGVAAGVPLTPAAKAEPEPEPVEVEVLSPMPELPEPVAVLPLPEPTAPRTAAYAAPRRAARAVLSKAAPAKAPATEKPKSVSAAVPAAKPFPAPKPPVPEVAPEPAAKAAAPEPERETVIPPRPETAPAPALSVPKELPKETAAPKKAPAKKPAAKKPAAASKKRSVAALLADRIPAAEDRPEAERIPLLAALAAEETARAAEAAAKTVPAQSAPVLPETADKETAPAADAPAEKKKPAKTAGTARTGKKTAPAKKKEAVTEKPAAPKTEKPSVPKTEKPAAVRDKKSALPPELRRVMDAAEAEPVPVRGGDPANPPVTAQEARKPDGAPDGRELYRMGLTFFNGEGQEQKPAEAALCFRRAAELGYADAQNMLGFCYFNGRGVTQDFGQAVYWYRRAAEQGNAAAQNDLGLCYFNGKGVPVDRIQAAFWFRQAAEQGNASAQNSLGYCYFSGEGLPADFRQAAEWYRRAAEQGNAGAQNSLGNRYFFGEGVERNLGQAAFWYRASARQGNADAQTNLGYCYLDGQGVGQDDGQAVYWFLQAAEQGNDEAQFQAGDCYRRGRGVGRNPQQAADWFRRSAGQGNADAQRALRELGL